MVPRSQIRLLTVAVGLGLAATAHADIASDIQKRMQSGTNAAATRTTPLPTAPATAPPGAGATSAFTPGKLMPPAAPAESHTISLAPAKGAQTTGISGDGLGTSFASLGDVVNDGVADFALGVPFAVNPTGSTGQVLVYNVPPGGLFPSPQVLRSTQLNNGFGYSVAGVGDVNGDGYADLLVGAPFHTDSGHNGCGKAYLYLGKVTGYNSTPSWTFTMLEDGAGVGYRVAWAGDVNRDGFDDWLVSAPFHSNGEASEGVVYLFYGGSAELSNTPVWEQESDIAETYYGYSIATAGDVNGDGYADFVVGAPNDENPLSKSPNEGALYLYAGGPGMPQHVPARKFYGEQFNAALGASAAAAGDVNADGYADFLAGAPNFTDDDADEGIVNLYRGGPIFALLPAPIRIQRSIPNAQFGSSVGTAGDFNGDGFSDIMIGAIGVPQIEGQGAAYMYLGNEALEFGTRYDEFDASGIDRTQGVWVGTLGDVNGDGRSEYASGETHAGGTGLIFFKYGRSLPYSNQDQLVGQGGFDGATLGVTGATADVDGDGYDDLICGSPNGGADLLSRGSVTLFRGGPRPFAPAGPYPFNSAAPDWSYVGGQANETIGSSLSNAGDVNADGYEDFLAGGFVYSNGNTLEGEAKLFYGSPSGPLGSPIWHTEGNEDIAFYGYAVAGGGDLNGDGFDDIAIGAPGADGPIEDEGKVAVYYGSALGPPHNPSKLLVGAQSSGEIGVGCVIVGDINRDGYDDLAVGAPFWDAPEASEGRILIYLGSAAGVDTLPSQQIQIDVVGAELGYSLARIGDVNGDGYADLAAGAPTYTNGETGEGLVLVYYGSPGGLVTPAGWTLEGDEVDLNLGATSIAGAGDYDNDGYNDLFVGSPYTDGGGTDVGRIRVFRGGPGGLDPTPLVDLVAAFNGINLGAAVGGMADFNGDGASDLYYTAPGYALAYGNEGVAAVRFGNLQDYNSFNPDRPVAAWRTDALAPVSPGLRSNANTAFSLHARGRSAAGRTRLKLEWEVKPQATPFNFAGRGLSAWQNTAPVVAGNGTSALFASNVPGLTTGTRYHWRARTRSASPLFPWTPWFGNERVGSTERMIVTGGVPGVVAVDPPAPGALALAAAAPNPFTETAALAFTLPRAGHAVLALYDLRGRLVRTVFDGAAKAGRTAATWDGKDESGRAVATGAYFSRLSFEGEERAGKVVRL